MPKTRQPIAELIGPRARRCGEATRRASRSSSLLVTTTITLIILGGTMQVFHDALKTNDAMVLMTDTNQNLRAGTNMMTRDLIQTGQRHSDRRHSGSLGQWRPGHSAAESAGPELRLSRQSRAAGDHVRRWTRTHNQRRGQ